MLLTLPEILTRKIAFFDCIRNGLNQLSSRFLRSLKSNVSDVLPDGTVSSMPWRKADVKYTQNEVYLDIVEEVDAILGVNGQVCSGHTGATAIIINWY